MLYFQCDLQRWCCNKLYYCLAQKEKKDSFPLNLTGHTTLVNSYFWITTKTNSWRPNFPTLTAQVVQEHLKNIYISLDSCWDFLLLFLRNVGIYLHANTVLQPRVLTPIHLIRLKTRRGTDACRK
jgi:hypothetical protein